MDLKKRLEKYKRKIDSELDKIFNSRIHDEEYASLKKTYEIMNDYVSIGGKRLRPIATIAAFESLKGKDEKIYSPAIGIELLHNSTLCHDDIMDEDKTRRNSSSCHKSYQKYYLDNFNEIDYNGDIFSKESMRFGVSISIIAGNLFNYLGYELISKSGFSEEVKSKAVSHISKVMTEVNKGQAIDIYFEKKKDVDEKAYFDVISKKTAWLLGGAFELGAIFAESSDDIRKHFFEYGFNLGLAFQITDDLMDIDRNSKKGNSFGSDVRKGKKTIIAINALETSDKKNYLISILEKEDCSDDEVEKIVEIFEECGAVEYAKEIARDKVKSAKERIDEISGKLNPEYVDFFKEIADYIVERKI